MTRFARVPVNWTGAPAVAAYLAGIRFYRPVAIEEVATVASRIVHTGPRSVHVSFRVIVGGSARELAARGMVAVVVPDERANARPVRQWKPQSAEDRRLDEHARHLIDLRQFIVPGTTAMTISDDAQPARLHSAPGTLPVSSASSHVLIA